MAADDVSLPDLEVIAQFSLAVRSATAPRAQVVAALEADLAALRGDARPRSTPSARPAVTAQAAPAQEPAPAQTPARARSKAPARAAVKAAVTAASKAPAPVARPRTPRAKA